MHKEKQPIKALYIWWDKCVGCRLCELACSRNHYQVLNPELSRIRIHNFNPGPMSIPVACSYCSDRPCVRVCPHDALHYEVDKGIIRVDKEKCLGVKCSICARACKGLRSNVIRFFPPDHDYALICDKCDGDPQCVKVCPEGVLDYQPIALMPAGEHFADPPEKIAEDVAIKRWHPTKGVMRVKIPWESVSK